MRYLEIILTRKETKSKPTSVEEKVPEYVVKDKQIPVEEKVPEYVVKDKSKSVRETSNSKKNNRKIHIQ